MEFDTILREICKICSLSLYQTIARLCVNATNSFAVLSDVSRCASLVACIASESPDVAPLSNEQCAVVRKLNCPTLHCSRVVDHVS